jgi:hypothetical protein
MFPECSLNIHPPLPGVHHLLRQQRATGVASARHVRGGELHHRHPQQGGVVQDERGQKQKQKSNLKMLENKKRKSLFIYFVFLINLYK